MQKRTTFLAAVALAAILVGVSVPSSAQHRVDEIDGCAVLADAVYGELFVSALFASSRLPPEPGQGDALSCNHTAAAVSSGFARAMAAMNVSVTWTTPAAQSSAVCASGDLALCYPLAKPMMARGALDAGSVPETWQIVSGIVSRTMPLGTSSDRSSFREYELRIFLSDALVNGYGNGLGWPHPRPTY